MMLVLDNSSSQLLLPCLLHCMSMSLLISRCTRPVLNSYYYYECVKRLCIRSRIAIILIGLAAVLSIQARELCFLGSLYSGSVGCLFVAWNMVWGRCLDTLADITCEFFGGFFIYYRGFHPYPACHKLFSRIILCLTFGW